MYLYAAMADLAAETGDRSLKAACERLWADVTSKRMYVTAGLGPSASNEGFTTDYDLPNATAYAETCASVALIFWAQRMLNLDCDSRYADVMELAFYNGALSGLSRDGTHYFYENPLESSGDHHRWTWHPCPCCPMNVARLIGSVGGYFYSVGDNLLAVHMYGGNSANVTLGGKAIRISQETNYPWSGDVALTIEADEPAEFELRLRVPGWAREATLALNGARADARKIGGYLALRRRWSSGDQVRLSLPMPVERIHAHPDVKMDIGRVALKRGPLIYCLEGIDNGGGPLNRFRLPPDAELRYEARPELLGGAGVIRAEAEISDVARLGRSALPSGPTLAPTRRAHRHSLLPLGQPRAGRDARLDSGVTASNRARTPQPPGERGEGADLGVQLGAAVTPVPESAMVLKQTRGPGCDEHGCLRQSRGSRARRRGRDGPLRRA